MPRARLTPEQRSIKNAWDRENHRLKRMEEARKRWEFRKAIQAAIDAKMAKA